MGFVANFIGFPAVQKFWKSIVIWKSLRHFKSGNFIETQCISHTTSDNSISILVPTLQQEPYAFLVCRVAPQQRFGINIIININIKRILWNQVKWELRLCVPRVGLKSDRTTGQMTGHLADRGSASRYMARGKKRWGRRLNWRCYRYRPTTCYTVTLQYI